jgi:hypothetical protein
MRIYDSSQDSVKQQEIASPQIIKEVLEVENKYVLPKYVPILLVLLTILNLIILIK